MAPRRHSMDQLAKAPMALRTPLPRFEIQVHINLTIYLSLPLPKAVTFSPRFYRYFSVDHPDPVPVPSTPERKKEEIHRPKHLVHWDQHILVFERLQ
jgi:hypothetical protein